ncbi:MAG: putative FtsW-like protein [Acidimicrobiales bacterium]|nr:MAG: putative FtsW-like protein [Acidimicrobiales bacterium]
MGGIRTVHTRHATGRRRPTVAGRARRSNELALVLVAVIVTVSAYALVGLSSGPDLPPDLLPFLGFVAVLFLSGHVVVRMFAPDADATLLPLAYLLNGLGYVTIARLDRDLAGLQATWTAVGIGVFTATLLLVRESKKLQRYRYTALAIALALLLLPLAPLVGAEIKGARIWVQLGPMNFQPGEFAKLALVVFLAGYLVERQELLASVGPRVGPLRLPDPRHMGPLLTAWAVSLCIMVFEKDLGSSLLFFTVFLACLWVATGRASWVVTGLSMFALGAWFARANFEHVARRIAIWLDPWRDPHDAGFQLIQGLFALSWGGFTGTGLGLGGDVSVPESATDMIYAVVGEELGFLGTTALLTAYLLMVGSGLRIAQRAGDRFESLLACGLTCMLAVQTFVIVGGVTRVLPLTGITLPFVSYGGSSLVANYALLALLLRVSDDATRRESLAAAAREAARR